MCAGMAIPLPSPGPPTHCHQKQRTLALCMGREKVGYGIIVEGEARGAKSQGIGCEIDSSRCDAGLQLGCPVTPIAEPIQDRLEVCHEVQVDAGIGAKSLAEGQLTCLGPELTLPDQLEGPAVSMVRVGTGSQTVYVVDYQVNVGERVALWRQEVRGYLVAGCLKNR